jgi:hypothetical protein
LMSFLSSARSTRQDRAVFGQERDRLFVGGHGLGKPCLPVQRLGEAADRDRIVGLESDRLREFLLRFRPAVQLAELEGERVMPDCARRFELDILAVGRGRLLPFACVPEGVPQSVVGGGVPRVGLGGLAIRGRCIVVTILIAPAIAEVDEGDRVVGLDLQRLPIGVDRLVVAFQGLQEVAEIVERLHVFGIGVDRLAVGCDRFVVAAQLLEGIGQHVQGGGTAPLQLDAF